MQFGKNIRIHRKRLGMTQLDLAKDIVSVSYISLIESNKIKPSYEIIRLLAERLETTVESLTVNLTDLSEQFREEIQNIEDLLYRVEIEKALEILNLIGCSIHKIEGNPPSLIMLWIRAQLFTGELEAAESHLKSIEKDSVLESDPVELNRYLLTKAIYYLVIRKFDRAISCLNQLERSDTVIDKDYAFTYLLMAICHMKNDRYKASFQYLNKAQELYLEQGRWLEVGLVRYVYALIDLKTCDLPSALRGLESLEQLLIILNHSRLLKHVYYSMGKVYYQMSDMRMATLSLSKSLQIQLEPKNDRLTASTYCLLAEIYFHENRYNLSVEYLNRSLKLGGSIYLRAKNYLLSAKVELSMNCSLDETNIHRMYRMAFKSGSRSLIKESNSLLGNYYFQKGDYKRAADYLFPRS